MTTKVQQTLLPVLTCLLAATLWGVMWYPMRLLEEWGLSGMWATLIIYLIATVVMLPVFWPQRRVIHQRPYLLLMIAVASGWANLGFILAVLEGNIVRVLLLFYLMPVWSVLLGWWILGESPSRTGWFSVILAMSGAVIMLWRPDGMLFVLSATDILAISAGFSFALLNVCVRRAGGISLPVKIVPSCFGVVVLCLFGIVFLDTPAPVWTTSSLILSILLGSIGVVVMSYSAQYGVTHMPVHRSSVLFLFEIVAGAVSAALLTDEVTTRAEWLGGCLVVTAAWVTAVEVLGTSKKTAS